MKKTLLAIGAITTLGVAGIVGAQAAFADTNKSSDPMSSMVSAIATKFNLNKDEVQAVFDEQHATMQQERESQRTTDVSQLVTDGKITQAQADAINAKHEELKKEMEANRTNGTRPTQAEMEAKKTALDKWATDNGIDQQYLRYVMGGHGRGHGPDAPQA